MLIAVVGLSFAVAVAVAVAAMGQDKTALPVEEGQEVRLLWYACDQRVRSAKLEGALEGDERMQWWEEQKKFIIQDEPDEEGGEGQA